MTGDLTCFCAITSSAEIAAMPGSVLGVALLERLAVERQPLLATTS
jgi:hypothetical protein